MLKDSPSSFGRLSIINHWTLALLIIGMLIFGLVLEEMPRGETKRELMSLHKSIGFTILFLGLWRVGWRVIQGFPNPVAGVKNWEITVSKIVHIVLLVGIVVMPLSGYLMSTSTGKSISYFGLFDVGGVVESKSVKDLAHDVHGIAAKIMIATVLLHIAAVIKHHFIVKDNVLRRMLGKS